MATNTWTGQSGDWSDANDWTGGVPTNTDNVQISTPGITVTVSTAGDVCYGLSTSQSTFGVEAGGSLYTVNNAFFGGTYEQSGGVYMAAGSGAVFDAGLAMTGGAMMALAGATFNVAGGGSIAGTFSGNGTLAFTGGQTYLNAGFSSSISSIVVNALVGFDTNFTSANYFAEQNNGNLDFFGHKVTLSGTSLIDNIVGNGTLVDSGTMTLGSINASPTLDNGLILQVKGHAIQSSSLSIGASDAGAKIEIMKSGQYVIDGNYGINDPSSIGSITNAGLFAKTAGGRTAGIAASFSSTGTIQAQSGMIMLNGLVNNLSGTVSGAGTLGIGGGVTTFGTKLALSMASLDQQSGDLVLNRAIGFAGEWDQNGGVLNLNSTAATLTLTGADDFDGGLLSGYGGTVLLNGQTQLANFTVGGPTTLTVNGTLDQTGNVTFGASSNPLATINAGATWSIEADSHIDGQYGVIDNKGTFTDPNGAGTAYVSPEFETTGTVTVGAGILQLRGPSYLGGIVNGAGLLDLDGATQLYNGLSITVAELDVQNTVSLNGDLGYANAFSETNNGTLDLGGHTFTLSGTASFDTGNITDGGTVVASGAATIDNLTIQGGSTLDITGTAEQTANVNVNSAALLIARGAAYTLDDDYSIGGTAALVTIAGDLIASGTGFDTINANTNLTGTLQVNDQQLTLSGGGTLAGAIAGAGTLALANGTFIAASGFADSTAALTIENSAALAISASESFAGYLVNSGTLALSGGDTFSLSGTTVMNGNATITGTGTVLDSGDTTLSALTLLNGATLDVTGTAEQGPINVTVGATAILEVAATSLYSLDANQSILGLGTLDVAGTLSAIGDGTTLLAPAIVDAGTISNNLGTLDVMSTVSGNGNFMIGASGTLEFAQSGTITASNSVSFTGAHSQLILSDEANNTVTFGAVLDHFSTGNSIELYDFSAASESLSMVTSTQWVVNDGNGNSITLNFGSAQSTATLYLGSTADGRVLVLHH